MSCNTYPILNLNRFLKRKQLEADKELTKALENEIKDGIREKIKHANKQREV
jgi:hypothetical protein